jgi:ABC-type nitrate/sulfonate/bicarbonate transport system substrate-binding protein
VSSDRSPGRSKGAHNRTRKLALLATTVVAASLLLGVFGSAAPAAENAAAEPSQVRPPNLRGKSFTIVSTEPGINTMILYKAMDLMRQWGANVTIRHVSAPANVVAAVGAGQADVGDVPPLVGLQANLQGLDIKAFAMSQARTDDVFVAKSSIQNLSQLRGAKIGVLTTRGLNGIEVAQVLSVANLNQSDVDVIIVGGQTVRVAALIAGRVDAGPISMDNYNGALRPAGFNVLYNYASQMPNLLRSFLWAKPSWIAANRDVAAAMNEALLQTFRWVSNTKNRAAFVKYVTDELNGVTAAAATSTYNDFIRYKIFHVNSAITPAAVTVNENLFLQHDLIPRRPNSADWVDVSYSQNALKRLGKVRLTGANRVSATVAANGRISLGGVTGIFNGPARITVVDSSTTDNVRLKGPGVNRATTAPFKGRTVWTVNLRPGTYTVSSDRSPRRGVKFIVTESG